MRTRPIPRLGWYLSAATLVAVVAAPAPTPVEAAASEADRSGEEWAGYFLFSGRNPYPVHVRLAGPGGTIDVPTYGDSLPERRPLARLEADADRVRFDVHASLGTFRIDGRRREETIDGTVTYQDRVAGSPEAVLQHEDLKGTLRLTKVAKVTDEQYARYVGTYEIRPGDRLLVVRSGVGGVAVFHTVSPMASVRLFPRSEGEFVAPSPDPDRPVLRFEAAGDARQRAVWRDPGGRAVEATKLEASRHEELTFRSGGVTLAGTLLTPSRGGPFKCVVLVHGSRAQERDGNWFLAHAEHFLRHGIGVFIYDKRGVGGSGGDWTRASIQDLAGDALAAVDALRRHPRVRPDGVGVMGGSQGGWIAPLAASGSRDVAFVVAVAASGVSPKENEMYQERVQWKASGLSDSETGQLERLWRRFLEAATTGERLQEYDASLAGPWPAPVSVRLPPHSRQIPPWYRHLGMDFDPLPVWRQVRCPVLVMNGALDTLVPPNQSLERIGRALEQGGNRDHLLKLIPGGNHGLCVQQPDGTWGYAPGVFDTVTDWIAAR